MNLFTYSYVLAILSEMTLMLAWSHEEAASILETYKLFENKPPDMIMEKSGTEPHEKLIEALTSVKSVNKTDAVTLLGTFKTLGEIVKATPEDLALCPGVGPNKAKKLHKVLHESFRRNAEISVMDLDTRLYYYDASVFHKVHPLLACLFRK